MMTKTKIDFEAIVSLVFNWYDDAEDWLDEGEYLDSIQVIPANKDGRIEGLTDWVEIKKVTNKFITKAFTEAIKRGATGIEFYAKVYGEDEQHTGEDYILNFNMTGEEI